MSSKDAARPRVVLTIGKFDGVHRGHRALAAVTAARGAVLSARPAALVIDPHPATVLAGARVPMLMTFAERRAGLRATGLDIVDRLAFDARLAALSPIAFLDHLAERFDLAGLVVGPDFAFGMDRAGDLATLKEQGADRGFEVTVAPPVCVGHERVASGGIKAHVSAGEISEAHALLGRPPTLRGVVIEGAKRGRTLGYPTANLAPTADYVVPADGVYACRVGWIDRSGVQRSVGGAASIGTRPTFDDGPRSIEVHLLDIDEDLYGLSLEVAWLARLRGELRFESVTDLLVAMAGDLARTRAVLLSREVDATYS